MWPHYYFAHKLKGPYKRIIVFYAMLVNIALKFIATLESVRYNSFPFQAIVEFFA